jgi:hypothetical protein
VEPVPVSSCGSCKESQMQCTSSTMPQIFAKQVFQHGTVEYLSQSTAVSLLAGSIELHPLLIFPWPSTRVFNCAIYRGVLFSLFHSSCDSLHLRGSPRLLSGACVSRIMYEEVFADSIMWIPNHRIILCRQCQPFLQGR